MTTQSRTSNPQFTGNIIPLLQSDAVFKMTRPGTPKICQINTDYFNWEKMTLRLPLVHLLQPDFFCIFRFQQPGTILYQENLRLELGAVEVNYARLLQYTEPGDVAHLQRTDRIISQFASECHLQAFDFISSTIIRWNGPGNDMRYLIRKTSILQNDENGMPLYGIMAFKDITPMISSVRTGQMDITFHPDRADLCQELMRRIKAAQPKPQNHFTSREKDIIRCLSEGMSSKEIASVLFISKATVDTHRQNLIHKWEVTNTAALLKLAMENGCI